jgi:PKD repeat protein
MYTLDPGFLNSTPYSFSWFDGTTDSVHAVTHGGSYYLKVNDNIGCAFSDTIQIKMDSLLSNISLGADTTFCSGNIIGLEQGGTNAVSFLWSTGSNSASIPVITTGQYWLTVKSINNCSATDTINVTVSGKAPVSDFVFANTCLKNVTQFTDQSTPPSGETISAWDWTFGDSFGSATPNPVHVYADTGKYTVQLTVTTLAGCAASFSKVISIFPKPQLNFLTSMLCEDINVAFTGQATTFGAAIKKWSWNFADPASGTANTSTLQNPVHLFASGGMYAVSLIGENIHGCPDTISKNINVNSAPVTDFSYSIACKDDTVFFKDATVLPSGTTNIGNYWSFGNGSSVLLNPNHVFPANVLYNVMHVVTASNGCKDTVIKKVDVHASPTARFVSSTSCEAAPTDFTDQSFIPIGSIVSWEWTFENKDHSAVQNPSHSFLKAGNVLVKQLVTSDFGCKDSISKTLVVYPKPTAQFTATPNYGNPGQSLKFTNTSSGAVSYVWNFDDGNTSTVVNPTHIFKDIGEYHLSLVAISTYGCKDSATTTISILKRFIDVAINDATVQVQNGGGLLLNDYLNVHVNLTNKSTSDLFVLDLYMEANDGTAIKETWTGKFLKGDAMGYDFKATPSLKPEGHFICVYALYPNGLPDEVPGDNKFCKALDEGTFKILPPYPNPTEDLIVIPLVIPNNGELMMTIYDSRGKQIQIPYEGTITPGLQLITIDTREFNSGLYVCKAELDGQKIVTKFIKQ